MSKLLGFGEACFGVLKVSCCGVASWALRNLATSVSMIWICFQVYVVGVACLHRENPGGSACSSLPVRLDHLFFTRRFCLQALFLFLLLYFHMCKPQTNLVNVCAQLISLRNEHFFGDTFDVLCFHMYKLQAYFQNISVLRILHDHTFDLLCFHMYKPNQISILGSGGNLQLPRAKKRN